MSRTIARDHDDKRAAILREAARLFAAQDYGRASIADVARACGISKANIYHYYASKDDLLFAILENHLLYLNERISTLTYPSPDPSAKLTHLMTEVLLAYQGADAEHDVLLNATGALPADRQEILRQYQRDFIALGRAVLEELAPPELVADRPRMRALTMSVFGMLNWHYKWNHAADACTRRADAQMMAALVLGGINALGPVPPPAP